MQLNRAGAGDGDIRTLAASNQRALQVTVGPQVEGNVPVDGLQQSPDFQF